jgi:hypothetical protein
VPRETARERGRRLLAEGRLVVRRIDTSEITAVCRGDSGAIHRLGYRSSRWWCECEARTQCGHLYALQLVTIAPVGAWVDIGDLLRRDAADSWPADDRERRLAESLEPSGAGRPRGDAV